MSTVFCEIRNVYKLKDLLDIRRSFVKACRRPRKVTRQYCVRRNFLSKGFINANVTKLVRITDLFLFLYITFFMKALPGGFIGADALRSAISSRLLIDEFARFRSIDVISSYACFYRIVPPLRYGAFSFPACANRVYCRHISDCWQFLAL